MKTDRNILIAFILNFAFSLFEFFGGIFTGSIAILSDAVHDIGDAVGIGISYFLEKKSKRKADETYTYGYARYSVLGSVMITSLLLVSSLVVIFNAMERMMKREGCSAFTNTFQDLYGMEQLPGLASQHLMAKGYGYGGEGDWKVSALTAIMKAMGESENGASAFMEDYTYHLEEGNEYSLGAHMLEVCPSLSATKPKIETHHLGIGMNEKDPARLVFDGKAGSAIVVSLVDMGGRFRLICQDVECVSPIMDMPRLPVAKVMWKPMPNLTEGVECWITAGGAHHTVLSYDVTAEEMKDFAAMMDIEFVHINKSTTLSSLEQQLMISDIYWKLK